MSMTPDQLDALMTTFATDVGLVNNLVHGDENTTVVLGAKTTDSLRRMVASVKEAQSTDLGQAVDEATRRAEAAAAGAKTSETAAGQSASAAKTSEIAAAQSAAAAKTSEIAAGQSASAAKTSEIAAGQSASAAKTSEIAAGQSASAAKTSEIAAAQSAAAAKTSENAAGQSASAAKASANEAALTATHFEADIEGLYDRIDQTEADHDDDISHLLFAAAITAAQGLISTTTNGLELYKLGGYQ